MIQLENAVTRFGKVILTELKEAGIIAWIAGGAVRDYFMAEKVNTDYDIFFPNEIEWNKAVTFFKVKMAEVLFENNATLKVKYSGKKFDLVKKYFDTPQATIDNFDFTVSMFAINTENVFYGETSFMDLAKRQLMINIITFPASTLNRAFRYYKKGFTMCNGEMKKLVEAIQGMPKVEVEAAPELVNEPPSGDDDGTFFLGFD